MQAWDKMPLYATKDSRSVISKYHEHGLMRITWLLNMILLFYSFSCIMPSSRTSPFAAIIPSVPSSFMHQRPLPPIKNTACFSTNHCMFVRVTRWFWKLILKLINSLVPANRNYFILEENFTKTDSRINNVYFFFFWYLTVLSSIIYLDTIKIINNNNVSEMRCVKPISAFAPILSMILWVLVKHLSFYCFSIIKNI